MCSAVMRWKSNTTQEVEKLHAKIGQLAMENDFLPNCSGANAERAPGEDSNRASVTQGPRCQLLAVPRSTAYYEPTPVSAQDLLLMRLSDEVHLRYPFYGSRRIRDELLDRGEAVNRKRGQRLMRLQALYSRRRTSQPGRGHKILPLPAPGSGSRPYGPGVGDGYHVHPHSEGLHVLGRDYRLVLSPGTVLAGVEHPGHGFLRRGPRRDFTALRRAANLQRRLGRAIHFRGLHRSAQTAWGRHQHGRQGPMGGRRLRRTSLAQRQVRRHLPARL